MTERDGDRTRQGGRPDVAAYWAEQMEAGLAFVERVLVHPLEEDREPLVDIREEAERAGVELAFSQTAHPSGQARLFLVRRGVIGPLLAAAAELRESGHTLLLEDGFRTREIQRDIARRDDVLGQLVAAIRAIEPEADLDTMIRRLAVVVAARPRGAGHMAGAAVDVSVIGPDGELLDRGAPPLTISELMPLASPFVSDEAARNRRFVADAMARHGFAAYPYEFWHFSCDDAFARVAQGDPRPARYGPVELQSDGAVVPVADQLDLLNERDELAGRLERLLHADATS